MSEKTCRYFVYAISFFCISFWFGKRHLGEVRIMISDDVTGTSEIQVQNQHSKTSSSKASMSNSNVIIQKRRFYSIAIVVVGEIRHSKTDMEIWDSCARHLLAPLQRNNHIVDVYLLYPVSRESGEIAEAILLRWRNLVHSVHDASEWKPDLLEEHNDTGLQNIPKSKARFHETQFARMSNL